jgi:hypothetical protein
VRVPNDALRHAAKKSTRESSATVATNDNDIGAPAIGAAHDFRVGGAARNEDFRQFEADLGASVRDERLARAGVGIGGVGIGGVGLCEERAGRQDRGEVVRRRHHVARCE